MIWVDPTTPNLADYAAFLVSVAGIPPNDAPNVLPGLSGSATAGTTTSLTDLNQSWAAGQWNGCTVYDSTANLCAIITSTSSNQVTFATLTQAPAAGDAYVIVQPIVPITLGVALRTVNQALNAVDPALYTLATYNLAADRLINFALDQKGQTFFKDLRNDLRLTEMTLGVVSSSSDESTSSSVLNPEWMNNMTLRDLQTLRTPYGRAYMEIVMDYGSNIWTLV